jgi:hypothetical protein
VAEGVCGIAAVQHALSRAHTEIETDPRGYPTTWAAALEHVEDGVIRIARTL